MLGFVGSHRFVGLLPFSLSKPSLCLLSFFAMAKEFAIEIVHPNDIAVVTFNCPKDAMSLGFFLSFFFLPFSYIYAIKLRYDNCVPRFASGLIT